MDEKVESFQKTFREKSEKLESENEFFRSTKEKGKKAQEAASDGAKMLSENSRFRRFANTTSSLFKEAKDDLLGADAETRKQRREGKKRIRERKAERIAARNEALAEKMAAKEAAASQENDADDQEAGGGMKSDWAEAIDEESGDPYYYNVKTGETTWDKPAGFGEMGTAGDSDQQDAEVGEEEIGAETGTTVNKKEYVTISESESHRLF